MLTMAILTMALLTMALLTLQVLTPDGSSEGMCTGDSGGPAFLPAADVASYRGDARARAWQAAHPGLQPLVQVGVLSLVPPTTDTSARLFPRVLLPNYVSIDPSIYLLRSACSRL